MRAKSRAFNGLSLSCIEGDTQNCWRGCENQAPVGLVAVEDSGWLEQAVFVLAFFHAEILPRLSGVWSGWEKANAGIQSCHEESILTKLSDERPAIGLKRSCGPRGGAKPAPHRTMPDCHIPRSKMQDFIRRFESRIFRVSG